ncbi:MAG: thioredoxin-like domain-containing protein [Bacteroidetes bacterium]|nr:thioredoxin-like domain-containing protein [Bacteroidota bacterium]
MIRKVLLPAFLLSSVLCSSQNSLEGTIHALSNSKVYLSGMYGERIKVSDSTISDSLGRIHFILPTGFAPGFYKVGWSKTGFVNLILNRENVKFETWDSFPQDSLKVLSSLENQIFQSFTSMGRTSQSKLELLMPLVDFYPARNEFYRNAVTEFETTQKIQLARLDSVSDKYPGLYAIRMEKVIRTPYISASLSANDRIEFLKQHYWDKVDFNDTALLRSNVFADKIISYLALYQNNRFSQRQLEGEFIKAVTVALGAASVNPNVYKFMLDYLVGGFDKYHFDDVITYIADNFQDPFSCEDAARKSTLQKKLDNFKKLSIGKTAPAIEVPDLKGNTISLLALKNEFTLLVFWSSQCPHCTEMMPNLKAWYDKQKTKRLEVVAVSLDTSRTAWASFIKKEKLNWINVSELKGYSGKAEDEYNIYATPTMYLLDRDKKIIAKPITWRELEQALNQQIK